MKDIKKWKVFIVDDHTLFRKGMKELIEDFNDFSVIGEAQNGKDLINKLKQENIPDIILLDLSMPLMDGYETASWLKKNLPQVKVLALSMHDHEQSIIKMLKLGAKGYILKDATPLELLKAFDDLVIKGMYCSDLVNFTLLKQLQDDDKKGNKLPSSINARELEFLKYVCTELTYKEISDRMNVAPRTVDGYRESLFEKLKVKNKPNLK